LFEKSLVDLVDRVVIVRTSSVSTLVRTTSVIGHC